MKKIILSLLFFIVSSMACASLVNYSTIMRLTPPKKVTYFLDRLFSQGKLTKELVEDYEQLVQKLENAEFTIIKTSGKKIVAQLPRPNQNYLMKVDVSSLDSQSNCSRVFQAKRLRDAIQRRGLTKIHVPEKYLYHIPGREKKVSDGNYVVITKSIRINKKKNIFNTSTKSLQQLWYAMAYTHYFDHGLYVDLKEKIVQVGDSVCVDDAMRIALINTKDCKEVSDMEAFNTVESIKKMLSINGVTNKAPQEALFAHVLMEHGKRMHRYEWQIKGKILLRKVYTVTAGFLPFAMIKGHLVMPMVMDLVREVENMAQSLVAKNPTLYEYYRRKIRDHMTVGGDFSVSLRELVRKHWPVWRAQRDIPFAVEGGVS